MDAHCEICMEIGYCNDFFLAWNQTFVQDTSSWSVCNKLHRLDPFDCVYQNIILASWINILHSLFCDLKKALYSVINNISFGNQVFQHSVEILMSTNYSPLLYDLRFVFLWYGICSKTSSWEEISCCVTFNSTCKGR